MQTAQRLYSMSLPDWRPSRVGIRCWLIAVGCRITYAVEFDEMAIDLRAIFLLSFRIETNEILLKTIRYRLTLRIVAVATWLIARQRMVHDPPTLWATRTMV